MSAVTYILRCSDGSFYTGHTTDLDARLKLHNDGHGPQYTRDRRPVMLAYFEPHDSVSNAIKRERQIKRWTSAKKQALIDGEFQTLKMLAKRRRPRNQI